jgi:hypothetical protein
MKKLLLLTLSLAAFFSLSHLNAYSRQELEALLSDDYEAEVSLWDKLAVHSILERNDNVNKNPHFAPHRFTRMCVAYNSNNSSVIKNPNAKEVFIKIAEEDALWILKNESQVQALIGPKDHGHTPQEALQLAHRLLKELNK